MIKMHNTFRVMTLLIMTAILATGAAANCRVIDTLDKIHMTQTRLANNPETPLRLSELRYLRRHSALLSNIVVLDAVGTSALSAQGASFLRFTRNLDELLNRVSIDDADALRRHYANPNVRTNMDSIGRRLRDLKCSAAEIARSEIPDTQESELSEFLRHVVLDYFNKKNIFILVGIISVALTCAYLCRPKRPDDSRRSKRHFANYDVIYRVDNQILSGTIMNISKSGAKLKHRQMEQPVLGSAINILLMEDTWFPCVVSWSSHSYCGVAFKTPLSDEQEQHVRKSGTETKHAA